MVELFKSRWSLTGVIRSAQTAFYQYPLVILSSILVTSLGIYLVERDESIIWMEKLIQVATLGIPLFLSLNLYSHRHQLNSKTRQAAFFVILLLMALHYFTLEDELVLKHYLRFTLWIISFHLLVSFIAYWRISELKGFWQFNQSLFLRLLTGSLYSMVLYLGITLALVAIQVLFDADIGYKVYFQLWIFIVGIFNTWFFLSGIPRDFALLEQETFYPKGLKLFTEFVLLPLVSIYLLILYVYGLKILFTWNLPQGWVTYLVLAFSGAGIFSLLLVYPIQDEAKNRWIKLYARFFYLALFPLIILLFVAIGRRIIDYGITELRYLVLVLAIWLVVNALYYLLRSHKNIQFIPVSLAFALFLSSFGPWGAFSIAENSQVSRLVDIYRKNNLLQEGQLQIQARDSASLNSADRENIQSIVNFLGNRNRLEALQAWVKVDLDTLLKEDLSGWEKEEKILDLLGQGFDSNPWNEESTRIIYYSAQTWNRVLSVKDYDYVINLETYPFASDSIEVYTLGKQAYQIKRLNEENQLLLGLKDPFQVIMRFDLNSLIDRLKKDHAMGESNLDPAELTLLEAADGYEARLEIQEIQIKTRLNGENSYSTLSGRLYIAWK